jgi:large subunit ribosomal protein L5
MPTRLQEKYVNVIRPSLVKEFSYKNTLEAPRLDKIVINMGVGEAVGDGKRIQSAVQDLTSFAGQKPVITKARKAIANFKLREGMNIGC